jgi:Immunoglobulin-like domain of bacterial spore germination
LHDDVERPLMSRFRLIALGIASVALVVAASGCAGGYTPGGDNGPNPGSSESAAPETGFKITSPGVGQTVHTPFVVGGKAPELTGPLFVDILDPSKTVLCFVEIPQADVVDGAWKTTFSFASPPRDTQMTVRVYEKDASGEPAKLVNASIGVSSFLVPPVSITSPACHATISGASLAVSGQAKTFEGQAVVALRDATGTALSTANITAASSDAYTPWSTTLAIPAGIPAGLYTLVAYTLSPKDGSPQDEFPIQVVVG